VQTDHKPLTVILKTREVNKLTNRLQRFRIRLLKFNFDISYVPGSKLYVADALSRAPLAEGVNDRSRHKTSSLVLSDRKLTQQYVPKTE
jgi:hypothetical protein